MRCELASDLKKPSRKACKKDSKIGLNQARKADDGQVATRERRVGFQ
jgi:hypothetical protein